MLDRAARLARLGTRLVSALAGLLMLALLVLVRTVLVRLVLVRTSLKSVILITTAFRSLLFTVM